MPPATRVATGALVIGAGLIHLWLWGRGGYRHAPGPVGPSFVVDAVLSAIVGTLVLLRGDRRAAWAGSALSGAALLAYITARTVGLSGFQERAWTRLSLLAAGCEAVVLVLLLTEALVPEGQ
ncbi:MAG: hypothetical protein NVS3B21_22040 [Acidimicrobiales bacterium]